MSNNTNRTADLLTAALKVRREVLGDEYVDRAMEADDNLSTAFQPFMSSYCWGEIWTDETLSRRERSLLVLGMTSALNRMDEFEIHTRGALNNGVTPDELLAVLKQVTVYCGVPAGVGALKRIRKILADTNSVTSAEYDIPTDSRTDRGI